MIGATSKTIGRSGSATVITAIFLLGITLSGTADTIQFDNNWGEAGFNLISHDGSGVEIVFSVPEMALLDQIIDGEMMQWVQIPGVFLPNDAGAPDLPFASRYIAIPEGASASVEIVAAQTEVLQGLNIAPAPPIPAENDDRPPVFVKDPDIYNHNGYFPEEAVLLSDVMQMRGVDVVILRVSPFQYNPVTQELVVYKDIRVNVSFQGGGSQFGEERLRSRYWEPILKQNLLNYSSLPQVDFNKIPPQTDEENVEYIIIVEDDPMYIAWADTIKQWRIQQGISTGIATTTEIGSNSATAIQSWLITAYYTWTTPPVAALIIGDYAPDFGTGGIATMTWNGGYDQCISDNMYADVNVDNLPEFAIARITAQNEAELERTIHKFLDYERTPPTAPNFYDQPVIAGGWQDERWFILCTEVIYGYLETVLGKHPVREYAIYQGTPGTFWSTNSNTWMITNYFGPTGLGYIPVNSSHLTDWGGNASRINADLNSGAFIMQHRDHGYEGGWGEPDYSSNDLYNLNNDMLPFVFSTNCLTGKYDAPSPCFAENFHRMEQGCLGIIAATEVSYSFVNDAYQWGVYDAMWPDFDPGYGDPDQANLRTCFGNASGKWYLQASSWPSNPGSKAITHHLFHHHGDAFTTLYSEVPQNLAVTHQPILFAGHDNFTVTADEGSVIALTTNGEIIGLADGTGGPQAIPIAPQLPGSDLIVTVTKPNHYRYIDELPIVTESPNYVIFYALVINDGSGNANGELDLGETVTLDFAVQNMGTADATNIDVSITSEDEYVTIIDGDETYAFIASGARVRATDAFEIQASTDIPDNHILAFTMTATDGDSIWISPFNIAAIAPEVIYDGLTVDDANANANGQLDPGETADFIVAMENSGSGDAGEVTFTMGCDEPLITLGDAVTLPEIAAGATEDVLFTGISADAEISQGDTILFWVAMEGVSGYTAVDSFTVIIGDYRYNPTGPDAYGYYAIDSYDGEDGYVYDWLEISPSMGGVGADLNLTTGEAVMVDLPFGFQFYGQFFDQITVCAHGWVAFGEVSTFFPNNTYLPFAVPPDNFVAGFWDDLDPGMAGIICTAYDPNNNCFIIEWYFIPHASSIMDYECFQILLLDPNVYQTASGDGEIVVQYHTVSDRDNLCTVGIENADATDAIQYLFNDTYDSKAMPLEGGLAVKFTTNDPAVGVAGEGLAHGLPQEYNLGQNYPNPF
ncbi:hypothetical protein KJ564_11495, partial [bacterium]|nr:hypothetical protein [bacterium]